MSDNSREPHEYYGQSAEIYDILSEQHWASRRTSVLDAFRTASPETELVLDIGSGTGVALGIIREAFPQARIHAIEPSASMRIGLMTRILADPQLRQKVTVHPHDIATAPLPSGIDVAMVCGCVGFFDEPARLALWPRLAAALSPTGIVLLDTMPLDRPQQVPESLVASADIGDHRFDIWLRGEPVEDDAQLIRWHMRFDQSAGATRIRSFSVERDWRTLGLDTLLAETARAGFQARRLDDSPVPAALLRLAAGPA
ncbi:class I SAM-dependent methyltransferase [Stutzerimonas kirkiae]|nr:class I SAM-dependent methyltransferase [Stutzerimonas kirkiae]